MYDLIIIGGGPAAISAGIYAGRKKLKTLILTKNWGGQTSWAPLVENYPGFEGIAGIELIAKMVAQLKKNDVEIKEETEVEKVNLTDNIISVKIKGEKEEYQAKAAIIATGRIPRRLGLPNEEKFIGKGISYCATCDAPLFKNKVVAVIGGANAGLSTALALSDYASKVYVLECIAQLPADEFFIEKIKNVPKIEILTDVSIKEIKGNQFIENLVYQKRGSSQKKEIAVSGIFVAIGSIANSLLVKDVVELNQQGEIKVDSSNSTSQSNVFAAGDVTNVSHKQIVIAAGEGAKAALGAYEYIKKIPNGANKQKPIFYSCF